MLSKPALKFGLIGCGSFGQFCLRALSTIDEVQLLAVADTDTKRARDTAREFGVAFCENPNKLISNPDIEMIHIVTPPDTHYELSMAALRSGKHVLCEKPLALSLSEVDEMLQLAEENGKIIPVNFILRYVPLVDLVKKIIDCKVLGEPIRAFFENYATDENLKPDHWFWNKDKSGGIFVEHGVHFFDLYSHWLGDANMIWAYTTNRESTRQEDRVFCFLQYDSGVVASHYHGFDQPKVIDRQIHRLLFERGDMVVHGWVPEWFEIEALLDDSKIRQLEEIFKPTHRQTIKKLNVTEQNIQARGKEFRAEKRVFTEYRQNIDKLDLYTAAIQNLVRDQIKFIHDRKHRRIITEENGRQALRLAVAARKFAGDSYR
ncbi:MAG: Gfo/Idh/MocA family oxidoreductase [bacterium]|nr:MAG: Gfo/Idh/MocA family oxidoreductase [bacterium]